MINNTTIDDTDRAIVVATQEGLPLVPEPYEHIAHQIGISSNEVMSRMSAMMDSGIIRRIGVVPNHYKLGYKANAMSVWNVPDDKISELGQKIGAFDFVSHCYHRPRHLPEWPYSLFAMIHGKDKEIVEKHAEEIADALGDYDQGHMLLYSTKILKKTGLRLKV